MARDKAKKEEAVADEAPKKKGGKLFLVLGILLVLGGAGEPADDRIPLQHRHRHPILREHVGRREPGGPAAEHDDPVPRFEPVDLAAKGRMGWVGHDLR